MVARQSKAFNDDFDSLSGVSRKLKYRELFLKTFPDFVFPDESELYSIFHEKSYFVIIDEAFTALKAVQQNIEKLTVFERNTFSILFLYHDVEFVRTDNPVNSMELLSYLFTKTREPAMAMKFIARFFHEFHSTVAVDQPLPLLREWMNVTDFTFFVHAPIQLFFSFIHEEPLNNDPSNNAMKLDLIYNIMKKQINQQSELQQEKHSSLLNLKRREQQNRHFNR